MPSGYAAQLQRLWTGGADDFTPPDMLEMDASQALANCFTFDRPGLRRRLGLNQVAIAKSGLGSGYDPIFAKAFTFRGKGERLCGLVNAGAASSRFFVWDGNTVTGVLAIDDSRLWTPEAELVQFADRIYVLDPSQDPVYWEFGNTLLTPDPGGETAMPRGVTGAYFKFRGYVANERTLFFSLLLGNIGRDPDLERSGSFGQKIFDWHPQQSFPIETGNAVKIAPFHNLMLVILTDGGIETFEPDPCSILDSATTVVSRNIGCGAKHSVQNCGEDLLFVDREGHVRGLKQTITDEAQGVVNRPLSQSIRGTVARINLNRLSETRSAYFRGYYFVSWVMDGRAGARETWAFAIKEQKWLGPIRFHENATTATAGYPVFGWLTAKLKGDSEKLYVLSRDGSNVAQLYRAFSGQTDDSLAIPWEYTSRAWDMGLPRQEKTWQAVELRLRFIDSNADAAISIKVEARLNDKDWTTVGTQSFSPNATLVLNDGGGSPLLDDSGSPPVLNDYSVQVETLPMTGFGRSHTVQFRLSVTESVSKFELVGIQPIALADTIKMD